MDQSLFEKGLLKSFFEKRPLAGGLSDDGAASSSLALADLAALGASSLLRGGFKASATRDMKRAASPLASSGTASAPHRAASPARPCPPWRSRSARGRAPGPCGRDGRRPRSDEHRLNSSH